MKDMPHLASALLGHKHQNLDTEDQRVQRQIPEFASINQLPLKFAKLVRDGKSSVKTMPSLESRGEGEHDE